MKRQIVYNRSWAKLPQDPITIYPEAYGFRKGKPDYNLNIAVGESTVSLDKDEVVRFINVLTTALDEADAFVEQERAKHEAYAAKRVATVEVKS